MGDAPPLISLVVPTRDRPEFVRAILAELERQTFRDFEVIVSDNALRRPLNPNPPVFDGVRFRYVRPPAPVWMTDHWEFALAHARGRYVGVLGDKSTLVLDALEEVVACIRRESPDAISWAVGNFRPLTADLAGPGVVTLPRIPHGRLARVDASEALDYLLTTYFDPSASADHQLEIRGSLYHGVYSAALIAAVRSRFGRVFHHYAPDVTAQCAGLQVARNVIAIGRPLEIVLAGPSNGRAIGTNFNAMLKTQEEAALGASGASRPLIPDVRFSLSHLVASDLAAVSGRVPGAGEAVALHRRAAFELYSLEGWPSLGTFWAQHAALWRSAVRIDPEFGRDLIGQALRAKRENVKRHVVAELRRRFGERPWTLRRDLIRSRRAGGGRSAPNLREALDSIR
jgi:hypothetical protein